MSQMTMPARVMLAIGVPMFLFFATSISAYLLTARTIEAHDSETLLVYLAIMTGIGGIIGSIAAIVLLRGIVQPLNELQTGAEAFERGELDWRIETSGSLELTALADTLNKMAESRRRAETQLEALAYEDPLTKLPNRALFRNRLSDAMGHSERSKQLVALLLLDLDHFKHVNDALGHPAGDALLQVVAKRLLGCVRLTDTVARLGGDEFAVIQNHINDRHRVRDVAQRIIDSLAEEVRLGDDRVHTGASVGIALYPDDTEEPDELLRSADIALYRAKQQGRGNFYLYDATLDREVKARSSLEQDLRKAFDKAELSVVYQPIRELASGRIVGVEALSRWHHPVRGRVPPDAFVEVAEHTGLITQITDHVLIRACEDVQSWGFANDGGFRVAVNLSALDFRRPDLVKHVATLLGERGLDPRGLEFEITERVIMNDDDQVMTTLQGLRDLGIELSIDDFGTGYSSLQYLRKFPMTRIKIDKTFIENVMHDRSNASIARSVITMAHGLGMKVVAEGVETAEQADFLAVENCDEIQGYFVSKELSPDAVAALQRGPNQVAR